MKVKYDVTGVEAGDRDLPKAGIYSAKISEVEYRTNSRKPGTPDSNGKNDVHLTWEITAPKENKGFPLHDYVSLNEGAEFRMRQYVDALGLKEKGELDFSTLVGKTAQVRVKVTKSEEWGEQAKLASVLPPKDAGDAEDLDTDGDGATDDGEDYSEWSADDLKAELEERGLKVSGRFSSAKAIAILEQNDAEGSDDDPDEGSPDSDVDFDEMSAKELVAHFNEHHEDEDLAEITGKGPASKKAERLRDWLKENTEPSGDGAAPEDDYDEWDLDDLKTEITERGIEVKGRGSKAKYIAALREDDADDDPFADD